MWTGREKVEWGKHRGKLWKEIHHNTLDWYIDNLDDGPLKISAEAEKARREKVTGGNYLMYDYEK